MGRSTATSSRFAAAWSQSPGHIVGVARLIKANMTQRVTRVPEVYEHEAAFCHAPHKIEFQLGTGSRLMTFFELLPGTIFAQASVSSADHGDGSSEPSLLHTGLFGLDRRTRDRAVRTEHATIAGFWL